MDSSILRDRTRLLALSREGSEELVAQVIEDLVKFLSVISYERESKIFLSHENAMHPRFSAWFWSVGGLCR